MSEDQRSQLMKSLEHRRVKFEHAMPEGTVYTCASCEEEHTVLDPACVVYFNSRLSHIDCLVMQLGDIVLATEALTRHPDDLYEINAFCSGNGIWWCSRDECKHYNMDNHTCKILMESPKSVCVPWLSKLVKGIKDSAVLENV